MRTNPVAIATEETDETPIESADCLSLNIDMPHLSVVDLLPSDHASDDVSPLLPGSTIGVAMPTDINVETPHPPPKPPHSAAPSGDMDTTGSNIAVAPPSQKKERKIDPTSSRSPSKQPRH